MLETNSNPSIVLSYILRDYGWLDPKFWVRRQSYRCSHFGDDDPLVIGSDLDKSLLKWRIVGKSIKWLPNSELQAVKYLPFDNPAPNEEK